MQTDKWVQSTPTHALKNPRSLIKLDSGWLVIAIFALLSAVLIAAKAGSVFRIAFPFGTLVVSIFLYGRNPLLYMGFTWWILFLSSLVRRLIDYQSGWVDPSTVLLAPFLALLVTAVPCIRSLPRTSQQGGFPFLISFSGVLYSFLIGLINNPPISAVLSLLNWLAPMLLGYYLYINWRHYPAYKQNLQRVFLWGVLVMGSYGILQFMAPAAWDVFWVNNADISTIGSPLPFQLRVFSTLNSPGPFGIVTMAGLLLLLSSGGTLLFPSSVAGYLSFLLSQVRSAWLGWFIGLLTLFPALQPKFQFRLVLTILILSVLITPLTAIEPFASVINARVQSLSSAQDDVSYQERSQGYSEVFDAAISEFAGKGLGFVLEGATIGVNDSGILTSLFSLGWIGSIPYFFGILTLLFQIFHSPDKRADPFMSAACAISVGTFIQISLGNATIAQSGVVFWAFSGIALAASKYYKHQRHIIYHDVHLSNFQQTHEQPSEQKN